MSAPDPALLDRVRKLLALGGSPNVHEAALAAAHAQRLITRHRLEDWLAAEAEVADDPDPITDGREAPLEVARRARKWKVALAVALCEANGCVAWVWSRADDQAICAVGRARDRVGVEALWEALVRRIEWLSATAGPGRSRRWHEAFRIGAVDAIAERVATSREDAHDHLPQTALAVVDARDAAHTAALQRFVEENLGRGRGRAITVDRRAWQAGRAAGAALSWPGDE